MMTHQPVMLKECIQHLAIKPEGVYIDGTFGRGGHAAEILNRLGPKGRLLAMDKDPEAFKAAKHHPPFKSEPRFLMHAGSFTGLLEMAQKNNVVGKVDGILLDLGVSSPQLDNPERGFSFLQDGPLDMRMDTQNSMDAASFVNNAREQEIANVLKIYGEERFAKRIAKAIVDARKKKRVTRTTELANIIAKASPSRERKKHPATRSFQAIRIFVNNELDDLCICLEQCLKVLNKHGRLVVLTFHSLEDRIVKKFMVDQEKSDIPSDVPLVERDFERHFQRPHRKAIRPHLIEIETNPRARSAQLRTLEKIK